MTRHPLKLVFLALGASACAMDFEPGFAQQPSAAARAAMERDRVVAPAVALSPKTIAAAEFSTPRGAAQRAEISANLAHGQCVAPTHVMSVTRMFDTTPLERPTPLILVKGDRDHAMGQVSKLLRDRGFKETSRNMDTGELHATRADATVQGVRDDLLVWADGQAGDASRIRIYLQYGRYEPFFGSPKPERVQTTPDEMQQRIGSVRQAILDLAAGGQ